MMLWMCACLFASGQDIVVYGATPAGVAAALQAKRMGKTVTLLEPSKHIGGLTASGLGWTDSGDKAVVGGISREFYRNIRKHYQKPESWTFEKREDYRLFREGEDAMWTFEPKVAEMVMFSMLRAEGIEPRLGQRLVRSKGMGVEKQDGRIVSIRLEGGERVRGKVFLDATYEGDLMAEAGIPFHVGREGAAEFNETLAGVQKAKNVHNHRFTKPVDPFKVKGDPKSGLLFGIEESLPPDGTADKRVQAYCYRLCMTRVKANKVDWPKPEGYDERDFELLLRNVEAGDIRMPFKPDPMPNGKTDTNNNGAFSTDFIGQNYDYPEASYTRRREIELAHERYQKGFFYTLANNPRVPAPLRESVATWGLSKDEFTGTGNWPHQIYVREARRMRGALVQTERHCRALDPIDDSVGMGSYNMDSHNCARYVTDKGLVQNEGDIQVSPGGAYPISYRALTPKAGDCRNLLVPVCLSSSHMAYGSIRMEPVFFVLGQSAGTAAVMAIDRNAGVQDVPYAELKARLLKDGQVLTYARPARAAQGIDPSKIPGIVADDSKGEAKGDWSHSSANGPFVGDGYRHDGNEGKGSKKFILSADLPQPGMYMVGISFSPNANRATNVPVVVHHAGGTTRVMVNQRKSPGAGGFAPLGTFKLEKGIAKVEILTEGTDGHVIVDAARWLPSK